MQAPSGYFLYLFLLSSPLLLFPEWRSVVTKSLPMVFWEEGPVSVRVV